MPLVLVLLSCPGPDNILGIWLETNRNYGSRPTEEKQFYMERAGMLKICSHGKLPWSLPPAASSPLPSFPWPASPAPSLSPIRDSSCTPSSPAPSAGGRFPGKARRLGHLPHNTSYMSHDVTTQASQMSSEHLVHTDQPKRHLQCCRASLHLTFIPCWRSFHTHLILCHLGCTHVHLARLKPEKSYSHTG